jgi:hypothetical protein
MMETPAGVKSNGDTSFITNKLHILHHAKGAESCCEHVDLRIDDETSSMPSTLIPTVAEAA